MKYAGFLPRLVSIIVDSLLMLPITYLFMKARVTSNISWELEFLYIPYIFLFSAYNISFLAMWGKTVGKMLVKIEVVKFDESEINTKQAFLRHSVDFIYALVWSIITIYALLSIDRQTFNALEWSGRKNMIAKAIPSWSRLLTYASTIWVASELIVLLLNQKKRAIHDYIAGTVVIYSAGEKSSNKSL